MVEFFMSIVNSVFVLIIREIILLYDMFVLLDSFGRIVHMKQAP